MRTCSWNDGRKHAIPLLIFLVGPFSLQGLCRWDGTLGRHVDIILISLAQRRDPGGGGYQWTKSSQALSKREEVREEYGENRILGGFILQAASKRMK